MGFLKYTLAQLKIAGKKAPAIFALSAVFLFGTLLIAFALRTSSLLDESQNKISIALVGDTDDDYLGVGINLLASMDYSRYSIDFVETTEKEARDLLKSKKIKAYIVVPEGFVESFAYGENQKLTFVMRDDIDGYGISLTRDFLEMVSDFVIASQSSVYSTFDVAGEFVSEDDLFHATDELMLKEVALAIERDDLFEVEYIGSSYNLSIAGYYFCSLILIVMMLCGIAGYSFFSDRKAKRIQFLTSHGIGPLKQIPAEYVAYSLYQGIFIMIVISAAFFVYAWKGFDIAGFDISDLTDARVVIGKFIPVIFAVTAWQFLIYELIGSRTTSVSTQFFVLLFVSYFSGLFYPIDFYPAIVRNVSSKTLFGVLMSYMSKTVMFEDAGFELIYIYLSVIVFVAAAIFLRRRKLEK